MQNLRQRANLSEAVADRVRDMILDGRLPPGSRVNEVQLAARQGVSRTPLREALSRLVAEGALRDLPRRGFFVRQLTAEEVRHIYPIRSLLDPAALRLAGIPPAIAIERLRKLNRSLGDARKPTEAVALDDRFHLELIADCPNPVLVELIKQFMWRTRRYELGLMRHSGGMPGAVATHERILAALDARDLDAACRELQGNLARGQEPVLAWLAGRKVPEGEHA